MNIRRYFISTTERHHHFSSLSPPMLIHYPVWFVCRTKWQIRCYEWSDHLSINLFVKGQLQPQSGMTNVFWNSCISANVSVFSDFAIFLPFQSINYTVFEWIVHLCTLCLMLRQFYIKCWCFEHILSENKEKEKKEKRLSMCVISKDKGWGVERGHIISSSKCSSTERHIRHLPTTAKREQLWREREYQRVRRERERERERERSCVSRLCWMIDHLQ